MLKRIVLILGATLAAIYLIFWSLNSFGWDNPFLAFLINWLTLSWAAIVGQVVNFVLPASYYDILAIERTGKLYERLGVRLFKKLVRRGPLSVFNPGLRLPKEKNLLALQHLDREMRKAETAHLYIFVLMLVFSAYTLFRAGLVSMSWMLGFNILINGYPIMLQRYNRIIDGAPAARFVQRFKGLVESSNGLIEPENE
jgi:hypothetical protein